MAGKDVQKRDPSEPMPLSEDIVKRFAEMAVTVPTEDGAGSDRILEQLLSATSWEQLSDPWESSNGMRLRGKLLRIDNITRRPSTYEGGLGIFLVVEAVDTANGEKVVWTTSSLSVVGQLVRAYVMGWFPMYAEVVVADRPTERGYYPQHLRIENVKQAAS
jgi:hypothetical protein